MMGLGMTHSTDRQLVTSAQINPNMDKRSSRGRVIVNTVPHSGTHLVANLLRPLASHATYWSLTQGKRKVGLNWRLAEHPLNLFKREKLIAFKCGEPKTCKRLAIEEGVEEGEERTVPASHTPYSGKFHDIMEQENWSGVLVIRDPRDMAISMMNHIRTRPQHMVHDYMFDHLKNDSERLVAILKGFNGRNGRGLVGLQKMFDSVLQWTSCAKFCLVKFEDLVGEKGGGNAVHQLNVINSILGCVDPNGEYLEEEKLRIGQQIYEVHTFRKEP